MPLSKDDRIAFSKTIIDTDKEKANINVSQAQITANRLQKEKLDNGNKNLMDSRNALINPYQNELGRYTGIFRTQLVEQDLQDAADNILGNHLFPNNPQNPPPSTAPLTWTKTTPYARNKAVGKQYDENYPAVVSAEGPMITEILSAIAIIESYPLIQRVTGQECVEVMLVSTIQPNAVIQAQYAILDAAVNSMRPYILSTQSQILTTDPDPTRQAQNNTAIANIPSVVSALDTWLLLTPFNTAHGQSTCSGFNSYNPALLGPTRLQSAELSALKTAILTRQSFLTTRNAQINTYLGNLVQDLSTGLVTGTGFYFERWATVLLRLNFFGGSLMGLKAIDRTINSQNLQKEQLDLAKNTYSTFLTCSPLSAPSNGTKILHLRNAGDIVAGDTVYIASFTQEEITLKVSEVTGNKITVGTEIPAKYRPDEGARVYKDKS